MDYSIKPISSEDREAVIDIFNHYVENSFAAYPEVKIPYQGFDMFMQVSKGYPTGTIADKDNLIVGFGLLRVHNPMPAFSHTAEATYFIHPDHTGKGLGKVLLNYLEREGKGRGIRNILANISSLNPRSIEFHKKNGFVECGCFRNAGRKNGRLFDIVWMQKTI